MIVNIEKSRTDCLEEAASNPILMGEQVLENSSSEMYLWDRINEQGTAAIITETIDNRLPGLVEKAREILDVCEHIGFPTAIGQISEFETKIVTKLKQL